MGKVKLWMMDREERAASRGAADAYYRRMPKPHIWLDDMGTDVVEASDMTDHEIQSYWDGYENEEDRKEWD